MKPFHVSWNVHETVFHEMLWKKSFTVHPSLNSIKQFKIYWPFLTLKLGRSSLLRGASEIFSFHGTIAEPFISWIPYLEFWTHSIINFSVIKRISRIKKEKIDRQYGIYVCTYHTYPFMFLPVKEIYVFHLNGSLVHFQPALTCSKSTIGTAEKVVKYVQS